MKRFIVFVCVATAVVLVVWGATAGVPRLINYQGILTDDTGKPITGTRNLTFTIYPSDDPTPPVYWSEAHVGVEIDAGLFNVILGGAVTIPDSLFAGGDRWMGITVDGGSEMTPRMQITSVPWSFRSGAADSADVVWWGGISEMPAGFADGVDDVGGAGDGHSLDAVDADPTDVVYVGNDGQVGIGTTSPIAPLHVASGSTVLFGADTLGAGNKLMWLPSKPAFRVGSATASEWDWANIGVHSFAAGWNTTASGAVSTAMGVSSLATGYTSTAIGRGAEASSFVSTAIGSHNVGGGSPGTWVDTDPLFEIGNGTSSGNRKNAVTVLKNGNVGMGTTTPAYKLDVTDTVQMSGFKMPSGASAGYVLTSDSNGLGTWQPTSGIGGAGIVGRIPVFTGPQTLSNSIIHSTGVICRGGIGIGGEPVESKLLVIDKGTCTTLPSATYLARFQTEPAGSPVDQAHIEADGDAYFRGNLRVGGYAIIGGGGSIWNLGSSTLACRAGWVSYLDGFYELGSPSNRWDAVWAVNGTIQTSDARLKENVSDLQYGLEEIMELRPVSFRWRDHPEDGTRLGLIAQEVQPVISEVVADEYVAMIEGPNGPERTVKPAENIGMYYSQLIPVLIKAVQEQQGLIEQQAEKIKELEARISEVEN